MVHVPAAGAVQAGQAADPHIIDTLIAERAAKGGGKKPAKKAPRYTPVSRRQDRPDAIAWFLRHHPEVTDAQISKILGTTKATIEQVRARTHWNAANIKPVDPVTLGLVGQLELDALVKKAAEKKAKEAEIAKKKEAEAAKKAAEEKNADFIASKKFTGAKKGMVFKKGKKGLGYYKDTPPTPVVGQKRKGADAGPPKKRQMTLSGGLKVEIVKTGRENSQPVKKGQRALVRYDGRLATNGKRFDKGSIPFRVGAGEVIRGWDLGVEGMHLNEKRKLLIPPGLAYGKRGAPPDIPKNATLTFDVELLKIN